MSPSPPLVSVVIPARNAEATIGQTIESVRRQTLADFELIVIDDGSTDGTSACARGVADPRIRVCGLPHQGLAASRNRGLERATGEFVSFIDADDLWTPDKLEKQVEALGRRPEAALAYSWTAFLDAGGRYLFPKDATPFDGEVYLDLLRYCNFVASGSNLLVRRECASQLGGFDTSLAAAHDWDFCLRAAARWPFALVPKYQVLYRISETAMSANARQAEENCLVVCERAFRRAPPVPEAVRREALSAVKQYAAFLNLSRSGGVHWRASAARKLGESVRLRPRTLIEARTWKLLATCALLSALPAAVCRRAVYRLLTAQGRWAWVRRREVRDLVRTLRVMNAARSAEP